MQLSIKIVLPRLLWLDQNSVPLEGVVRKGGGFVRNDFSSSFVVLFVNIRFKKYCFYTINFDSFQDDFIFSSFSAGSGATSRGKLQWSGSVKDRHADGDPMTA